MNIEPIAILRCWAIDVDIGEDTYTIPPRPASDWLLPVAADSYLDIVPGLLEDPTALDDQLAEGDLGDECRDAARAAVTAAAGCPWWTARRLAGFVAGSWIGGELTLRGVDPTQLSLASYLAAVYRLATKHMEEAKKSALDMQLDQPPTEVPPEEWWDEDAAAASFEAAAARYG